MANIDDYSAGRLPLPNTMLVWHLTGTGLESLHLNEVPVPAIGPEELLCRIDAAGLCFSDIKILTLGADHPRIAGRDLQTDPVVMGHEVSLTVVQVGERLVGEYNVGDRFVVQADIIYHGQGLAFGYALPGALEQYVVIGKEILEGDEGRYIIPVQASTGYAEAALSEPWACVERSYRASHRNHLKQGGTAMVVALPGHDYRDVTWGALAEGPWPAKAIVAGLPAHLLGPLRQGVGQAAVESVACHNCALGAGYAYDDIILIGEHDPETVERAGKALAKGGILCQVRTSPLPRKVEIDVGRIHYDDIHYLGTSGSDIAQGYTSRDSNIKSGGKAWYIGAGGPMGQMHVQRAVEDPKGPALALCTDVDSNRLVTLPARYGEAASHRGMKLVALNPVEMGAESFAAKLQELAPDGFDDLVCLAPVPALISDALDHMACDGVLNIFAGLAKGTMAHLDLTPTFTKRVRLTGTSGSAISDLEFTLRKTERGELSPNRSVAAIGGMKAAREGLRAVKEGTFAGKIVIYPQILELPLTPLEELGNLLPEVAEQLGPRNTWTREAEIALIERFLEKP
ncbi:MAG: alcohol dehydrogenase catalytic domain-containing protein [Candidatus Zipacnadales bacterium]